MTSGSSEPGPTTADYETGLREDQGNSMTSNIVQPGPNNFTNHFEPGPKGTSIHYSIVGPGRKHYNLLRCLPGPTNTQDL